MPSPPPILANHSTKPFGWKLRQSSRKSGRIPPGSVRRIRIALMYCHVQSTTGKNSVVPGAFEAWLFQPR